MQTETSMSFGMTSIHYRKIISGLHWVYGISSGETFRVENRDFPVKLTHLVGFLYWINPKSMADYIQKCEGHYFERIEMN